MPTDYVAKIRNYDTAQLVTLLQAIRSGQPLAGWSRGKAFEHLVLRGFELDGADVEWPYNVPFAGHTVEQIDGAIYFENIVCLIESKDYKDPLNIEPIAKLRSQLARRTSGTMGIVFARTDFSAPMKDLTRMMNPLQILLWEAGELDYALKTQAANAATKSAPHGMCSALKLKYRMAIKFGMPDFDIKGSL